MHSGMKRIEDSNIENSINSLKNRKKNEEFENRKFNEFFEE